MNRIVCIEKLYHQQSGRNPTAVEHTFTRQVFTDEQPYGPKCVTLTEEWIALPLGWIELASMLLIVNESKDTIVEMTCVPPVAADRNMFDPKPKPPVADWLILPGLSHRGHPANLKVLRLRARQGTAKIAVTLFPE